MSDVSLRSAPSMRSNLALETRIECARLFAIVQVLYYTRELSSVEHCVLYIASDVCCARSIYMEKRKSHEKFIHEKDFFLHAIYGWEREMRILSGA